jgi:hypothetical protein
MSLLLFATPQLQPLLISFLVLVVILAVIGGLIYCIEAWISPLPPPVKLILALVLVIFVILWALKMFGGGQ